MDVQSPYRTNGLGREQLSENAVYRPVGSLVDRKLSLTYVYLRRDSQPVRLYAVDSSGEVVKHFQLSPPSPGLNVSSTGVAGANSLFLYFAHPPPQDPGEKPVPLSESLVGLFNTVSGQLDAVYKLPTKGLRMPCGFSALALANLFPFTVK